MITIAGKKLDESSKSARVEGYFKSLEKLAKYVFSHLLAQMFCQCLFLDAGPFVSPTQAGALSPVCIDDFSCVSGRTPSRRASASSSAM